MSVSDQYFTCGANSYFIEKLRKCFLVNARKVTANRRCVHVRQDGNRFELNVMFKIIDNKFINRQQLILISKFQKEPSAVKEKLGF